jgi:hypothetical protein
MDTQLTDDKQERNIRERLDLRSNVVDVFLVQEGTVLSKRQLAVRRQGSAITLRQVVDHERQDQVCTSGILLLDIFGKGRDNGDLGANIAIYG